MNVLFFLKPKASVAYIYDNNTVRQGLEKMKHYGYTAIPVIDHEGRYVGTVTEGDFLWKLTEASAWNPMRRSGSTCGISCSAAITRR